MTIEEIEDLALRKAPMPELENMTQINAYQAFRHLYDFAARSGMSQEQGKREKAEIVKTYNIGMLNERLLESTNKLWKAIELTAAAYAKAPSVETADALYQAIYGGAGRKKM